MSADLAALESLFLGLADKTRLRLLALMAPGPVPVAHLVSETGESQPKISRHLAYLRNAGLVETTRDGKWIYYGLATLPDGGADHAFRCVVDELSGIARPRKLERTLQERRREPELHVELGTREISEDNSPFVEPDTERTHSSEQPRVELDVFLL